MNHYGEVVWESDKQLGRRSILRLAIQDGVAYAVDTESRMPLTYIIDDDLVQYYSNKYNEVITRVVYIDYTKKVMAYEVGYGFVETTQYDVDMIKSFLLDCDIEDGVMD